MWVLFARHRPKREMANYAIAASREPLRALSGLMDEGPMPHVPDETLLKQFIAGDRHALEELAHRYEVALLGLACGLLNGRRELAMDVVQETWLRVIRYGRSFNGRSSVKTWLYRITINQCRNHKAAKRALALSSAETLEANQSEAYEPAERAETNHELRRVLHQLGPAKRNVVLLCYHAGMTHEQAAEVLGIPLGTLKSRLHAALKELRAALAEEVPA
jgi:RNA polymerase sigma-70 factor (ECF subfamily)